MGCNLQPCARTLARSPQTSAGEISCMLCIRQHSALPWNKSRLQSQWSTLKALFYCCFTAEIAEWSQKCLALLPHCSSRTWPAAGDGCTLRLFGAQQQRMWTLKNWKYQQSSHYATEFPAAGLMPAKLALFKIQTEFLHQPECVSWTKPT